ncbi:MAG: hypothetical protein HQL70_04845 [Magnetococcales bacterium]|nr:hypothetical protein [Magnetococcales bacterium]
MGIDPAQFCKYIIRPALNLIKMSTPSAELLLLGTAAQESGLGRYLHQLGSGPALGVFQMEPATYRDIWQNYLRFHPEITNNLALRWPMEPEPEEMISDLMLATVMCRLHYRRVAEPLPKSDDIVGLAAYWKKYYNTPAGRGRESGFIKSWHEHISGVEL